MRLLRNSGSKLILQIYGQKHHFLALRGLFHPSDTVKGCWSLQNVVSNNGLRRWITNGENTNGDTNGDTNRGHKQTQIEDTNSESHKMGIIL